MTQLYGLDPEAVAIATAAYINTDGTTHQKVAAAVITYQFAIDSRTPANESGRYFTYPSLDDVQSFLASFSEPEPEGTA